MKSDRERSLSKKKTSANSLALRLENNAARTESPEDARRADASTQRAWARHPRQLIVDNSSSELGFEGKLQRVIDAAAKIVGLPVTCRLVRKFVLDEPPPGRGAFAAAGVDLNAFTVTKTFLKSVPFRSAQKGGGLKPPKPTRSSSTSTWKRHAYVRERAAPGGARTYGYAEVLYDDVGDVHERKRRILRREYETHLKNADRDRGSVVQERLHFLWCNQSFVVHKYADRDLAILHCQAARPDGTLDFPPFLTVGREITDADRQSFSAYDLSLNKPDSPRRTTYAKHFPGA